ncbi:hypothetical protein TNCV_2105931 [Trichonephila clavipes]|nr:hypothetical protein TNCV_2105931 [Trichonephila clavipes]
MNGDEYSLQMRAGFSLSRDSHRILIWRVGKPQSSSNIIESDRRRFSHLTRYCNEILLPYVRLLEAPWVYSSFLMDDNAPCHRTVAAEQLLGETSSHGCFRCIKSSCITRLTQSRVRSGCTPLHHEQNPYKIQTAPGYYYKADELLRCFNKITTIQTSSLDVPPCNMSRTPPRFKQHRVTTTRPMNCYAVSTRLGRSRHRFFFSLPSGRGQPFVTKSP